MKAHWLTTIFGFLLAFGSAMVNAPGVRDNDVARDIGGIVQTVSALALGAAAADAKNAPTNKKEY